MSLIEDLNWRHSVKAYDLNKKVEQQKVDKIIEAARLAPTSSGLQPFRVIQVTDQSIKEQLVEGAFNPYSMSECSHVLIFAGWDNYSDDKVDEEYDMTTEIRGLPRGRFSSYTDKIEEIFSHQTQYQNFEHIKSQAYIALGYDC